MTRDSRYARNIDRIIQLLAESPRTHSELTALLHMSERRVWFYLAALRDGETRRVYVSKHVPSENGGKHLALFALGSRKDAVPPPRQTESQRSQKRREMFRKNPELHDRCKAKDRARHRVAKAKTRPITWFSALLGA